jgi:LPXTG-motif cell wall-anchored protein
VNHTSEVTLRRRVLLALAAVSVVAISFGGAVDAQTTGADLALGMTAPATTLAGSTYDLVATITNNGPDEAASVRFGLTFAPATSAATFVTAVPSVGAPCNVVADAVFCTSLGNLVTGATATVTVTVQVAADAAVDTPLNADGETISTSDSNGDNNQVLVTTNVAAPPPPSTTTTTTTTTAPASTTTTTIAATTTTTTTTAPASTTTTTIAATTTTIAAGAGLPQTGSSERGLVLASITALVLGGALILTARRPRRT